MALGSPVQSVQAVADHLLMCFMQHAGTGFSDGMTVNLEKASDATTQQGAE